MQDQAFSVCQKHVDFLKICFDAVSEISAAYVGMCSETMRAAMGYVWACSGVSGRYKKCFKEDRNYSDKMDGQTDMEECVGVHDAR